MRVRRITGTLLGAGLEAIHDIKDLTAFCLCSMNPSGAEFRSNELVGLAEEISRQNGIQAMICLMAQLIFLKVFLLLKMHACMRVCVCVKACACDCRCLAEARGTSFP